MCVSLCTTVVHNTPQDSSDNFSSYPPDNHHSSDNVYWKGGEQYDNMVKKQETKLSKERVTTELERVISIRSRW